MKTSVYSAFAALALFASGIASDAAAEGGSAGGKEYARYRSAGARDGSDTGSRNDQQRPSGLPSRVTSTSTVRLARHDPRPWAAQLIGQDLATLKDKTGKEFGLQLLNEARQGRIGFASYFLPKPNEPMRYTKRITSRRSIS